MSTYRPQLRAILEFDKPQVITEGKADAFDIDNLEDDATAAGSDFADPAESTSQRSADITKWRSNIPAPANESNEKDPELPGAKSMFTSKKTIRSTGLLFAVPVAGVSENGNGMLKLLGLLVLYHGLVIVLTTVRHPVRTVVRIRDRGREEIRAKRRERRQQKKEKKGGL